MRYMVICRETKAEGARRDQMTLASQRVFTRFEDAVDFCNEIAESRRAHVMAMVYPEDAQDVYENKHGREFLYLCETKTKHGQVVWLLDEDDHDVGIPKAGFEREFTRKGSPMEQTPSRPSTNEKHERGKR